VFISDADNAEGVDDDEGVVIFILEQCCSNIYKILPIAE